MPFNKDCILIKNLYLLKGYTAQNLLKKIPSTSWNKQSLQSLLKNLRYQFSWYGTADHELWILQRMWSCWW